MRIEQCQVTGVTDAATGSVTNAFLGRNRPDLQYTMDNKQYYVEWDRPLCADPTRSRRGDEHAQRILNNDPGVDFATQVTLMLVGACE